MQNQTLAELAVFEVIRRCIAKSEIDSGTISFSERERDQRYVLRAYPPPYESGAGERWQVAFEGEESEVAT